MGTEITIKVSGTRGTKFRLKYRAKRSFVDSLLGRGSYRWQKVQRTVPAEFRVSGTSVELGEVKKQSAGELTVELLGIPGAEMRVTL